MTRIDFYVLPELRNAAREAFAARLACKAFRAGHRVFLRVDDEASGERRDALLWEHPGGAFLPHARQDASQAALAPMVIGPEPSASGIHELLINLGEGLAEGFQSFDRVAEIVIDDEAQRAAARRNYRHYRERGYPLYHHDLGAGQP